MTNIEERMKIKYDTKNAKTEEEQKLKQNKNAQIEQIIKKLKHAPKGSIIEAYLKKRLDYLEEITKGD